MYDPYLYVTEKHFTLQGQAYGHLRSNPNLNNIIGDYQANYQYATDINQQVWSALANHGSVRYLVALLVQEYLQKTDNVELKFITVQSFGCALKLLVIIM